MMTSQQASDRTEKWKPAQGGGKKRKKKTGGTAKVVRTYSQKAGGYLADNKGVLHEVSEWAAKSLLKMVEPDYTTGTGKDQLPVWKTDEGGDRFTTVTHTGYKQVNACVYDAVREAMQSLGIGTLTPGDKTFFRTHPRVSTDGVNKATAAGSSGCTSKTGE